MLVRCLLLKALPPLDHEMEELKPPLAAAAAAAANNDEETDDSSDGNDDGTNV